MTKKSLITEANKKLEKLPIEKIQEVMDFADFLLAKTESSISNDTLLKMAAKSESFKFVNEDKVEYTIADIQKKIE